MCGPNDKGKLVKIKDIFFGIIILVFMFSLVDLLFCYTKGFNHQEPVWVVTILATLFSIIMSFTGGKPTL